MHSTIHKSYSGYQASTNKMTSIRKCRCCKRHDECCICVFQGSPHVQASVSARYAFVLADTPAKRPSTFFSARYAFHFLNTFFHWPQPTVILSQSLSSALANVIYNPSVMFFSCVSLIYVTICCPGRWNRSRSHTENNTFLLSITCVCSERSRRHTWPLKSVNCFPSMPRAPFSEDGYQRNHAHSRPQKSKHVDRSIPHV